MKGSERSETTDRAGAPGEAAPRKAWSPPQLTALDAGGETGGSQLCGSDGGSACFSCGTFCGAS